MSPSGRVPLYLAAACSIGIALLHLAIVVAGPGAYRYFGAPSLAAEIETGSVLRPVLITVAIAVLFALWGLYALAGAQAIGRLPLLRLSLLAIGTIYLLRGLILVPQLVAVARGTVFAPRFLVFSAVSLLAGACYLLGTGRAWRALGPSQSHVV